MESAKGGSDKKGGQDGDAPDIVTAKSCSRPSRNALGSKAAMDLTDQSTVVQRKTRRRGARKEDKNISVGNQADKGSKAAGKDEPWDN